MNWQFLAIKAPAFTLSALVHAGIFGALIGFGQASRPVPVTEINVVLVTDQPTGGTNQPAPRAEANQLPPEPVLMAEKTPLSVPDTAPVEVGQPTGVSEPTVARAEPELPPSQPPSDPVRFDDWPHETVSDPIIPVRTAALAEPVPIPPSVAAEPPPQLEPQPVVPQPALSPELLPPIADEPVTEVAALPPPTVVPRPPIPAAPVSQPRPVPTPKAKPHRPRPPETKLAKLQDMVPRPVRASVVESRPDLEQGIVDPAAAPLMDPAKLETPAAREEPRLQVAALRRAYAAFGAGQPKRVSAQPAAGNAKPRYPMTARQRRMQGRVLLRVAISPDGRSERVEVLESSGFGILDRAAVKSVRKWRFQPARLAGLEVRATLDLPIRFQLRD